MADHIATGISVQPLFKGLVSSLNEINRLQGYPATTLTKRRQKGRKMTLYGETITLYLMDGSPTGRWEAQLLNWNATAYKIPRERLKDCSNDLPALHGPGVYFLFGRDDAIWRQFIYIGEGDDALKRLMQPHDFEKDTSYWTEAVIFVTPDGTLEKGRIKYLENRFYTLAKEAGRYLVKNGNTPKQSPLSKQIQGSLEKFIANALLVIPALGHNAFEPLQSSASKNKDKEEGLLYFSRNQGKGGIGIGKQASDDFWLLKGSFIYSGIAPYAPKRIKELREEYADLISADGILQKDIVFRNPSYAAAFVCGARGKPADWKYEDGTPLKDGAATKKERPAPSAVSKKSTPAPAQGENPDEDIVFHFTGKGLSATGRMSGNGFIVFKGSSFSQSETDSCEERYQKKRRELIETGKVKDGVFVEDTFFDSPSGAVSCVNGGNESGNRRWIAPDGRPLGDFRKNT